MRSMAIPAVSAAFLLGASSLAMAAQPSRVDQNLNAQQSERAPTTSGDTTTPRYDGKGGQALPGDTSTHGSQGLPGNSTQPLDQSQVKQRLEQQGYSNVQGVHKRGDGWTANAEKNGQKVTLNLDNSGQVRTKTR